MTSFLLSAFKWAPFHHPPHANASGPIITPLGYAPILFFLMPGPLHFLLGLPQKTQNQSPEGGWEFRGLGWRHHGRTGHRRGEALVHIQPRLKVPSSLCHLPSPSRQVTDESAGLTPESESPAQLQNGARARSKAAGLCGGHGPWGTLGGVSCLGLRPPTAGSAVSGGAAAGACTISLVPDARSGYLW